MIETATTEAGRLQQQEADGILHTSEVKQGTNNKLNGSMDGGCRGNYDHDRDTAMSTSEVKVQLSGCYSCCPARDKTTREFVVV